jgi:DNA-binding MarR family transcriptional regulator
MISGSPSTEPIERYAAELLELFYPVHYRGNMALEDAMRGPLTRKQAAILWLIRTEGDEQTGMRRKVIEHRLQDWFDVSSSAITKALRAMSRAPLGLVRVVEDPRSGRERRVFLTPKGERFLLNMANEGRKFLKRVVEHIPEEQVQVGIQFLRAGVTAYEHGRARPEERNGKAKSGTASGKSGAAIDKSGAAINKSGAAIQ